MPTFFDADSDNKAKPPAYCTRSASQSDEMDTKTTKIGHGQVNSSDKLRVALEPSFNVNINNDVNADSRHITQHLPSS